MIVRVNDEKNGGVERLCCLSSLVVDATSTWKMHCLMKASDVGEGVYGTVNGCLVACGHHHVESPLRRSRTNRNLRSSRNLSWCPNRSQRKMIWRRGVAP